MEEFDFHASPKLPAAQIRDLAALRWLHAGESLILYGPVGVARPTSPRPSATSPSANTPRSASPRPAAPWLTSPAGADRTWTKRLADLTRPHVLILDDFAMRELTPQQADDLYELVTERARTARSMILTSNRAPQDWYPLFPNPVVAESLLDRLITGTAKSEGGRLGAVSGERGGT